MIESTSQKTAISKKTNLITANVESANTNQSEKEPGLAVRKNETIFSNTSNSPTSGRAKANHLPYRLKHDSSLWRLLTKVQTV